MIKRDRSRSAGAVIYPRDLESSELLAYVSHTTLELELFKLMAPRKKRKRSPKSAPKRPAPNNPFRAHASELKALVAAAEAPAPAPEPPPPPVIETAPLDDEQAFAMAMGQGVKPLTQTTRVAPNRRPPAPQPTLQRVAEESFERSLYAAFDRPNWSGHGRDPLREDLLRGGLSADKQVDLHGMREHQALDRVKAVVAEAQQRGWRVLRIIHGKGLHSAYGEAVLRDAVRDALSRPPLSSAISAWVEAFEGDGGAGVTYALTRDGRRR